MIIQNNRPNKGFGPKNKKEAQHRINNYITAQVVRVVGENIEPQIVSLREALAIADEQGMDLVEISPPGQPARMQGDGLPKVPLRAKEETEGNQSEQCQDGNQGDSPEPANQRT